METFKVISSVGKLVYQGTPKVTSFTDIGLNFIRYVFDGISSITTVKEALSKMAELKKVSANAFELEHIARTLIKYLDVDQRNVTVTISNGEVIIHE